jgi:hypothetical protein
MSALFLTVIPGRPEGPNPESRDTGRWNMDSGFAGVAAPRNDIG